jgi:hypothetical protein
MSFSLVLDSSELLVYVNKIQQHQEFVMDVLFVRLEKASLMSDTQVNFVGHFL